MCWGVSLGLFQYHSFLFLFCNDVENLVHGDGVDYESDERSRT